MPVGVCYLHSKMITFGVVCAVVNNLFTVQGIIACIVFLSTVLFLLLLYLRDGYVPDLRKKAVLITGCDTGFGHMLAKRLDAMGLCVFACCLTSNGETKLKGECSTKLRTLRLNVAEAGDVKEALEFVKTRLPPNQGLWAVVNNAGIGYPAPIEWQTLEEMKKVVDVNLWGTVAITKTFLPLLKKARGRIVNVASSAGRLANPGASAYCISKFGVEAFSDSLRNEVRHFGVTVHIIEPGVFKTNITDTERHAQHLDRLWESLDAETKESYGIEFLEKGKKMLVHYHWLRSPRTDKVVNAMAHAVTSGYPKLRYIVGWDHKLFWRTLSFLPSEVQDLVFISFPKPTGTCSKEKYS